MQANKWNFIFMVETKEFNMFVDPFQGHLSRKIKKSIGTVHAIL